MPLNLTKIRSKAEFMSKSQNIWQQIILLCTTVMQMICAWLFRGDCVTGVFDLCLNYLPFGKLTVKSRHLSLCWCFIDIFCNDKAICNIFIIFKHWQPSANKIYLEICRIKIITIPLSWRRMFYIMFNIYILILFKEPLDINRITFVYLV